MMFPEHQITMDHKKIKRLALRAIASDKTLNALLVFKGGNALDLIYEISPRGSLDLDFSLEGDWLPSEIESIGTKFHDSLDFTFKREGFHLFDCKFSKKPKNPSPNLPDFWGGYHLEFKIISEAVYSSLNSLKDDLNSIRRSAIPMGPAGSSSKFEVDISKLEYCGDKVLKNIDGVDIFVYSLESILFEKFRAICQRLPEYAQSIGSKAKGSGRARDFFDIFTILSSQKIDLSQNPKLPILKVIFDIKSVPLSLLSQVRGKREFFRQDWKSLVDTITESKKLRSFDFYFDFFLNQVEILKASGIV